MCMCMCMCMYSCMYKCICMGICMCMSMCVCICMCICMSMSMWSSSYDTLHCFFNLGDLLYTVSFSSEFCLYSGSACFPRSLGSSELLLASLLLTGVVSSSLLSESA